MLNLDFQKKNKRKQRIKAAKCFEEFHIYNISIFILLAQEAPPPKSPCMGFDTRGEREVDVDKRGKEYKFNGRNFPFK